MNATPRLAVIFDMDGVLIDSYEAHFQSWLAMTDETGRAMTQQEFDRTFGHTSREVIADVWPEKGFTAKQIAELDRKKEEVFRRLLDEDFPEMPGARKLLHDLAAAGFALAVGSSGPPENVQMTIDRLEIRPLLGAVVTGADVVRGKPDPQVFQIAAARLGRSPDECVVIEDAPDGVKAARAAGMAVVALSSTGRIRSLLTAADLIVGSLEELSPDRLREVIQQRPS
jgi:beta-phosphoglucomutase